MTDKAMPTGARAPVVYRNWIARLSGVPPRWAEEHALYTDSWVTGEATHGPYQLLNTVPIGMQGMPSPAIVLRLDYHLRGEPMPLGRGNPSDDLAALLSLCLGMRARAGNLTRRFEPNGDSRGRPCAWALRAEPVLTKPPMGHRVLPDLTASSRALSDSALLDTLPGLSPKQADALVRAARLYRDAIWVADSEPELSWIMLVSAIEAAAGQWRGEETLPVDTLRLSMPDLVEKLEKERGAQLLDDVARRLAPLLGSTRKFVGFIEAFLPDPPAQRPEEPFRYPWDRRNMRWSMRQIYDWRSRALHDGVPFPELVCAAPSQAEEKPLGTEDMKPTKRNPMPMLLHTFEYIVRHALLRWWQSMLSYV